MSFNGSSKSSSSISKDWSAGFRSLLTFVAIVIFLRGTVVEAFKIPSESMVPALRIGDHLLVSKLSYGLRVSFLTDSFLGIQLPVFYRPESLFMWGTPKRGDVVVFTRPDEEATLEDESSINLIKRVIGLPGDVVEVRNTSVFINNQRLDEPYAVWADGGLREGNFGPERVPEDHVLLLGDNRDHSKDSRFWQNPYIDVRRIKGRALIIYWSFDSFDRVGQFIK